MNQGSETMKELTITKMLQCQYALWEKHQDSWGDMTPNSARNSLLWMIEELGEAIAIIKKRGEEDIMHDPQLKAQFTEELVDVFMYFLDVLNRYEISGQDFSDAYEHKNKINQTRDFETQHHHYKRN